ncbi:hypothetical protein AB0J80_10240 [Actinoplanes sp. NPDC049548]|uniref:hypothetical protein n=1 Tax=Actinoplanes sp. NPDC049548 TaxID=3155152 RepID=UPI00342369B3
MDTARQGGSTGRPWRAIGAVVLVALGVVGLGVAASTPASALDRPHAIARQEPTHGKGEYTVHFDHTKAYTKIICLKSTTSMRERNGGNGDRQCSGRKGVTDGSFSLSIPYTPGDSVYVDFEMITGLGNTSKTKDNILVTGAHSCNISGILHAGKLDCDAPINVQSFSIPPMKPYAINTGDPNDPTMSILNLLAWCVTAAAVAGLIITGVNMALQLRRGEPGEFSEHWRGFVYVGAACLLALSAGPIVEFLNLGN